MHVTFPFLTAYDPPGSSEGSLDPLGLYQIADQLAVQLVPAVRERMQRIRFLTAMAVGALVTANIVDNPEQPDAPPFLVWEWLVVEALIREMGADSSLQGVPGTNMARRALDQYGYLDARSYLKTPRIFGFHGVYKRLAIHLGLVNVHLGAGPKAEGLVNAWARDHGFGSLEGAKPLLERWSTMVSRSLNSKPPRTKPGRGKETWAQLASAFAPGKCMAREKRYLRNLLLAADDQRLGALPVIWQLQAELDDDNFREESLHNLLVKREPGYGPLLSAIRNYEAFARRLQDAFDVLKAEAAQLDARGFVMQRIASDAEYQQSVEGLHEHYAAAYRAFGEVGISSVSLQNLFSGRFGAFAEPMDNGTCALAICAHHEVVQRAKSVDGKRPWFDRLGQDRIYIRHAYRQVRRPIQPDRYIHDYRGWPIRRFYYDLT